MGSGSVFCRLCSEQAVWLAWRRPTLPCLEAQYHGRCGVSRPSSEWDRVGHPRHDHQANKTSGAPARSGQGGAAGGAVLTGNRHGQAGRGRRAGCRGLDQQFLIAGLRSLASGLLFPLGRGRSVERLGPVSCARRRACTSGLSTWWSTTALKRDLVLRWVSRLDAFSGYPVRA